ncbi:copper-transporting ATPase 3-like protein, partial [Trifolium pratense]
CCGNLSPEPHYPSITRYPKGTSPAVEGSEAVITVVFCVMGMTCAACAGSIEKAIKRLPGIVEAMVDVLNDKAQVQYYPSIVN